MVLCNNGKRKTVSVHRVVAEAFVLNPNKYPIINHKDENKQNNKADNLEWCTHSYNRSYGNCNKNIQKTFSNVGISKKIRSIDLKTGEIKKYNSISEVKQYEYSFDCVRRCLHKRLKTYKGCKWEFEGDEHNWLDLKSRCQKKR